MFTLTIRTPGKKHTVSYNTPILLADALSGLGLTLPHPCGGNGTCGKCAVDLDGERVLSCQTAIEKDAVISVTPPAALSIETGNSIPPPVQPLIEDGYGLAVDIGTTTIAAHVFHYPGGNCVRTFGTANPQAAHGGDVISRITFAQNGGLALLRQEITEVLKTFTKDYPIQKSVIAGNTTMLHLLTGQDPSSIAAAPFTPQELFGRWAGDAYLAPCVSAYVGGDITTAILSSGMMAHPHALLVDIGTNGEMVLHKDGTLLCCATAAGPVFEGAEIRQGMPAGPGAIDRVFVIEKNLCYTTIGGLTPAGLCGSGLIDGVACLLELGIIEDNGYLEVPYPIGDSGILLYPEDVRMVQLAKSAICSGLETLLHEADLAQVEHAFIAGGFGSCLNLDSARRIGLLPYSFARNIHIIGNGSLAGAALLLQDRTAFDRLEGILSAAHTTELSSNPYFMDRYVENMFFPEE